MVRERLRALGGGQAEHGPEAEEPAAEAAGRAPSAEEAGEEEEEVCAEEWVSQASAEGAGAGALSSGCEGLQLHAVGHGNIGLRSDMEDRHVLYNLTSSSSCGSDRAPAASYLGVFDGHQGGDVAERLSKTLHRHLAADPAFPSDVAAALRGAFAAFDRELVQEHAARVAAGAPADGPEPGSTALAAVMSGCRMHLANLGDCRAVVAHRSEGARSGRSLDAGDEPWPLVL